MDSGHWRVCHPVVLAAVALLLLFVQPVHSRDASRFHQSKRSHRAKGSRHKADRVLSQPPRGGGTNGTNVAQAANSTAPTVNGSQLGGSAIAGGIAGLVVAGPLGGLASAIGAAVMAKKNDGTAGEVARASGDVMVSAAHRTKKIFDQSDHPMVEKTKVEANRVFSKAKEIDEKHRVVDKTKRTARYVATTAKDINEKHHVVEKTKKAASVAGTKAKEYNERHHLVEKAKKSIVAGADYVSKKFQQTEDEPSKRAGKASKKNDGTKKPPRGGVTRLTLSPWPGRRIRGSVPRRPLLIVDATIGILYSALFLFFPSRTLDIFFKYSFPPDLDPFLKTVVRMIAFNHLGYVAGLLTAPEERAIRVATAFLIAGGTVIVFYGQAALEVKWAFVSCTVLTAGLIVAHLLAF